MTDISRVYEAAFKASVAECLETLLAHIISFPLDDLSNRHPNATLHELVCLFFDGPVMTMARSDTTQKHCDDWFATCTALAQEADDDN